MAKKNRRVQSTIAFIKKRAGKKKSKRKARSNPLDIGGMLKGQGGELAKMVGPTLAAYVVARIVARISRNFVGRVPALQKHAGPISNVALLAGALWATSRVKAAKKYRTQLVVGVAISALQSVLKTYIPGLGNLLDESTVKPGSQGILNGLEGPGYAEGLSGSEVPGAAGAGASDDVTWVHPQLPGAATDGESDTDLYTGTFRRG